MNNQTSKTMVKKRLSIRDNALNKSIMNSTIDVSTGCIKRENLTIEIKDVERKQVSKSQIEEAKITIISSTDNSSDIFYKNLKEPDFDGCKVKELIAGFNDAKESFHQSKQKDKIWFDNESILKKYDSKYNFDAYIFGLYYGIRVYTKEHTIILNKLFPILKENKITEYDSFLSYCENLNCIIKNDNNIEIDEDRYQKALNDKLFNTKFLDS